MMKAFQLILLVVFLDVAAAGSRKTGCLGEYCCPSRKELFPGDSVVLTRNSNYADGTTWCDHEMLVRLDNDPCTNCAFTIDFEDYSTPFDPTITIYEANYTSSAFYLPTYVYFSTAATVGGLFGDSLSKTVVTTGNVLKIKFRNTNDYDGDLKITIKTKTPFDPNTSTYLAVGIAVGGTVLLIIIFVVICVAFRKKLTRPRVVGGGHGPNAIRIQ